MDTKIVTRFPDVETLAAVIARSPIVLARPKVCRRLPVGFDEADVAVLEWIAVEGRRARGTFLRI